MKKFLLLASLLIVTQATFAEETLSTKEVTPVVQTQVADITFDVVGQELTTEEKEKVEGGALNGYDQITSFVAGAGVDAAKQYYSKPEGERKLSDINVGQAVKEGIKQAAISTISIIPSAPKDAAKVVQVVVAIAKGGEKVAQYGAKEVLNNAVDSSKPVDRTPKPITSNPNTGNGNVRP